MELQRSVTGIDPSCLPASQIIPTWPVLHHCIFNQIGIETCIIDEWFMTEHFVCEALHILDKVSVIALIRMFLESGMHHRAWLRIIRVIIWVFEKEEETSIHNRLIQRIKTYTCQEFSANHVTNSHSSSSIETQNQELDTAHLYMYHSGLPFCMWFRITNSCAQLLFWYDVLFQLCLLAIPICANKLLQFLAWSLDIPTACQLLPQALPSTWPGLFTLYSKFVHNLWCFMDIAWQTQWTSREVRIVLRYIHKFNMWSNPTFRNQPSSHQVNNLWSWDNTHSHLKHNRCCVSNITSKVCLYTVCVLFNVQSFCSTLNHLREWPCRQTMRCGLPCQAWGCFELLKQKRKLDCSQSAYNDVQVAIAFTFGQHIACIYVYICLGSTHSMSHPLIVSFCHVCRW